MLIRRLLLVAFLPVIAIAIASCCSEDPFIPTAPNGEKPDSSKVAFLRVIHAAPNSPAVDVIISGDTLFKQPQGYLQFPAGVNDAQYYPVDTNGTVIDFRVPGGTTLASSPISLPKGSHHTAYFYGSQDNYKVLITEDEPTPVPNLATVKFRVVQLIPGGPSIDIRLGKGSVQPTTGDQPIASQLSFGTASSYITTDAGERPLLVTESGTGKQIIRIPGFILPGNAVITVLMVGNFKPSGDESFIFFQVFNESRLDPDKNLYGGLPFPFEIAAIRMLNLTPSGDKRLDLAILDSANGCDFPDCFRRNFPGMDPTTIAIPPLGSSPNGDKGYFFLSSFLTSRYPYRVEVNVLPDPFPRVQEVLVPKREFSIQGNKRYTIVAYGPATAGQAASATIFDNTPAPPVASGMIQARLFHGDYGTLKNQRLRLIVNGVQGPTTMVYGQTPDGENDSFEAPGGSSTITILDESNGTAYSQSGITLAPGSAYTLFLTRGADGTELMLNAVSEDVVK